VTVVVQARMGSTRLPGKVALPFGDRPMLAFQLARLGALAERLGGAGIDLAALVVATSELDRDDAVEALSRTAGVACHRGSEQDVLERVASVLDARPADHLVRLTADCPWTDPTLVADVVRTHLAVGADYTSNTLLRSWPDGLDVEVIAAEALSAARRDAAPGAEREHVTPHLQRHPERYALTQVVGTAPLGDLRWTVDTAEDLAILREPAGLPGATARPWADLLTVLPAGDAHEGGLRLRPLPGCDLPLPDDAASALATRRTGWAAGVGPAPRGFAATVWSAPAGRGFERPWVIEHRQPHGPGRAVGWVAVEVDAGGTGTPAGWWPADLDGDARRLLTAALAADAQVVALPHDPLRPRQTGTP
jgi:spore coat polysaccharide biosynthesis protein SpsF